VGGCESGADERPAMPDRKEIPHPCGSATPSVAWTLCSSGLASLSRWNYGVALSGGRIEENGSRKPEAGGCGMGAAERPAMPDRKGFPHPCGSATPSVAWTLCSSGLASLSRWNYGVALSGGRVAENGSRKPEAGGCGMGAGGCESEPPKDLLCPIAKDSRLPADRPRHPWRGRFALRA